MTGKDLMKGLNAIDDDLIEEAGRFAEKQLREESGTEDPAGKVIRPARWKRYYTYLAGAAACLVLLFGGLKIRSLNSSKTQSADVEVEAVEEAMPADAAGALAEVTQEKAEQIKAEQEKAEQEKAEQEKMAFDSGEEADYPDERFPGLAVTDGRFIYTCVERGVRITDIREEISEDEILLTLPDEVPDNRIREISLEGNNLMVVAEIREAEEEPEPENAIWYYGDAYEKTEVFAYNIEDPLTPELIGQMTQDGSYVMFLRSDGAAYLLTEEDEISHVTRIQSFRPETPADLIDTEIVSDEYGEFLSGLGSLFLVRTHYEEEAETEILRFSLEKGKITESGKAVLGGEIPTRLAVHETGEGVSVLTSAVSLLDRQMNRTGILELELPEEEICSVCFTGHMVYIMEAGEKSALKAADLSERSHPVLSGELIVKGRMEYLTLWGKDKLLAIGYTDGEEGTEPGICLQMIDISEDVSPRLCGELVLPGNFYSQAVSYDYETIAADPENSVIGFPAVQYGEDESHLHYFLVSYEDGKGFSVLADDEDERLTPSCRGICAGTSFYLTDREFVKKYPLKPEQTGE